MKIEDLDAVSNLIKPIAEQIGLLASRINTNRSIWSSNEMATRLQLIDPMLRAIGWDTADPAQVTPEYSVGSRNADYMLLSEAGPIAVVEAKNLGVKIDSDSRLQALSYVDAPTINFVIVTNGDRWELYSSSLSNTKPLSVFSVSRDAPHLAAIEAAKMSREVLIGTSRSRSENRKSEIKSKSGPSTPDVEKPHRPGNGSALDGWLTFDELEFKGKSPKLMVLPDGKQATISSWKGIWLTIAEWVTDRHPIHGEVLFGNNPNYMAARTKNEGFWNGFGEQLSNGYWVIGGTLNSRNARRCSRALLEHYGVDKNSFRFRFDNSP